MLEADWLLLLYLRENIRNSRGAYLLHPTGFSVPVKEFIRGHTHTNIGSANEALVYRCLYFMYVTWGGYMITCASGFADSHLSKPDQRPDLIASVPVHTQVGVWQTITPTSLTNRLDNAVINNHWGLSPAPNEISSTCLVSLIFFQEGRP